ncbi:MAG TPA: SDR family NAD(P)-dependent oxidoreductase [Candidatus Limihabitans stercoravium]|nr:SDR family NAD(P)-dependent oxidoreductase [Candidatus Limihabitans stercoravium]
MKTVLITGASRGIGAETVRAFAEKGYTVIANYNKSHDKAVALRDEMVSRGLDVHIFQADVSDSSQVEKMFCHIKRFYKKLDVVVNNAGVALYRQIQDTTDSQFERVMGVNCKGAFLVSREATKLFLERMQGSIVNISSVWGLRGASCESVYSMSKFAIVGLTLSLHEELNDCGINVNCVCPPIVETEMTANLSIEDKEEFSKKFGIPILDAVSVAQKILEVAESDESGNIVNFGG